jgi:hypothetical protein
VRAVDLRLRQRRKGGVGGDRLDRHAERFTLAAALSNALATSAGCCIDAASTLHRRDSIHRPTAAATPAQRTATALQKWAPQT